jgi:hypothetical protein
MSARTILLYLFGHAGAIREVAQSRAAFVTGLVLVLITTIPRNYDQTFIGENPLRWLLGSLVFSLVSGTWLYCVAYCNGVRIHLGDSEGTRPPYWQAWRSFMGLFWLTAPVAWLYALPVERFLDSIAATKANLMLLGIVSVWRVTLMVRVFHVLCRPPLLMTYLWVVTAAMCEVLAVAFFGGSFIKAVMAGMGGMRNSPEEEIIRSALGFVTAISFYGAPALGLLMLALNWRIDCEVRDFQAQEPGAVPGRMLGVVVVFWLLVAFQPQVQVARNATADALIAGGKYSALIAHLNALQPGDFAPSRQLPPKPFEVEVFKQLPQCFAALKPEAEPWVRAHFMRRLDEFTVHYLPRSPISDEVELTKFISRRIYGGSSRAVAADFQTLLEGLGKLPEGREWVQTNRTLIPGLELHCREPVIAGGTGYPDEAKQRAAWKAVADALARIKPAATNGLPPAEANAR